MNINRLKELLSEVSQGNVSPDDALAQLRTLPFDDLGFAKVDHHRALRTGFPEVIYGAGKTPEQIVRIAQSLSDAAHNVLITRLDPTAAEQVQVACPTLSYFPHARAATIVHTPPEIVGRGMVLVDRRRHFGSAGSRRGGADR